jgi:hypothetical protein
MESVARIAPPRNSTAISPHRALAVVGLAAVAAALAVSAPSFLSPGASSSLPATGGFAGPSVRLRAIQYVNEPASSHRLARVSCAGAAKGVSSCWVSRKDR